MSKLIYHMKLAIHGGMYNVLGAEMPRSYMQNNFV